MQNPVRVEKKLIILVIFVVACVFSFTQLTQIYQLNILAQDVKTESRKQAKTEATPQKSFFEDKFETWAEGSTHGNWFVNFNGEGSVGVEPDSASGDSKITLFQKPKAFAGDNDPSTNDKDTRSCLVTSSVAMSDFTLFLKMKTAKQLRTPTPNYWETAWVIWHYTDNDHFYYFTLKTNGWELGKRDPAFPGGQQFLKTGEKPKVNLGKFDGVRIDQIGATMTVTVNGEEVVKFTDPKNPYLTGKIGLYNEDAYAQFDDVSVTY